MNYNIGDILFQIITLLILLAIIFGIYSLIKKAISSNKQAKKIIEVEEKLDKVIELLEKEKK